VAPFTRGSWGYEVSTSLEGLLPPESVLRMMEAGDGCRYDQIDALRQLAARWRSLAAAGRGQLPEPVLPPAFTPGELQSIDWALGTAMDRLQGFDVADERSAISKVRDYLRRLPPEVRDEEISLRKETATAV
jgi:hypothetical protein